jgi:hypothetical protein
MAKTSTEAKELTTEEELAQAYAQIQKLQAESLEKDELIA